MTHATPQRSFRSIASPQGVVKLIGPSLCHVFRTGTVAGFAADRYLGIGCGEGIGVHVVTGMHVRGMALGRAK